MIEKNLPAKMNLEDTMAFLNIFGKNKPLTIQAFPERNKSSGNKAIPKIFYGTFSEHKAELIELNKAGYAICVLVNKSNQLGRKKTDIKKVRAVFLDLDGASPAPVKNAKIKPHVVVQSSPNKYHLYWFVTNCELEDFTKMQKAIASKFGGDPAVSDLSRVMRIPGSIHWKSKPCTSKLLRIRNTLPHYTVEQIIEGLELDLDLNADSIPQAVSNKEPGAGKLVAELNVDIIPTADAINLALAYIPADDRDTWLRIGMAVHSWDSSHVGYKVWSEWSAKSSKFDGVTQKKTWDSFKPIGEITVRTLFYLAKLNGATESFGIGLQYSMKNYESTDLGNSEFLVDQIEGNLYVIRETDQIMVWNGSRWVIDKNCLNTEAIVAVKAMAHAAKQSQDETHRLALQKHAKVCQSKARIDAMAGLAKKNPKIGISLLKLNNDPMLLGVQNGVLDLKTGEIRLAVPDDFITQFASVAYDPEAVCPLFLKFINDIMADDEEMIAYLQKAAGYTLTGLIKEHAMFILIGNGRNGKSLLINVLQKILGDYVVQQQPEFLMESRNPSAGPTPELAILPGKRMVCVPEVGEKHIMNQVLVKQLTGGDKISARALYTGIIEFNPKFKIWMTGNTKPAATAEDEALWRRFHLIPFKRKFIGKHQDKNLEEKLLEELPGILNWCVAGCLLWQKDGLKLPRASKAARSEYRNEMDILSQWLENCCEENSTGKFPVTLAYNLYVEWCKNARVKPHSNSEFGKLMALKFDKVRGSSGFFYRGIKSIPKG